MNKLVKTKIELAKIRSLNKQGVKTSEVIQGSGPLNRDGVPEIPPDQRKVNNWPILDLGVQPSIELDRWTLAVSGCCSNPKKFSFAELSKIGIVEDTSDFHCVTGWSRLGMKWKGIRLKDIAEFCKVKASAKHVYFEGSDGYSTNITMDEAMKDDVLIVFEANGEPLPKEHGGPVRMITPQLWAWKGSKWIKSIEFLENDRRGFWELRGYSNSAIPWLNDRYTSDEHD